MTVGTVSARPLRCPAPAGVHRAAAGPLRRAAVVHAGADAVHLESGGRCLSLLSARAVALPCGVVTPLASLPVPPPGATALVGAGALMLPGLRVELRGTVDVRVPRAPAGGATSPLTQARPSDSVVRHLAWARRLLPSASLARLRAGDPAAVPELLGLGPGLTPLGDDVLAGWLAAAAAWSLPRREPIAATVLDLAARRTTLLSATLLECAAHGEALPQVTRLLAALAAAGGGPLLDAERQAAAFAGLLAVGASSGAGLALGVLAALDGTTEGQEAA